MYDFDYVKWTMSWNVAEPTKIWG